MARGSPEGSEVLKKVGLWGGLSAGGGAVAAVGIGLAAPAIIGTAVVTGLVVGFGVLISSFGKK